MQAWLKGAAGARVLRVTKGLPAVAARPRLVSYRYGYQIAIE